MRGPPPSAVGGNGPARGRVGDNRSASEIGMSNSSIRPARAPFPDPVAAASVFEGGKDGESCRDPEDPGFGPVSVSEGGRRFGRAMLRMRRTAPGSLLSQESRAAFARTCRSSWTWNGRGPAVGSNVGATGRCAVSGCTRKCTSVYGNQGGNQHHPSARSLERVSCCLPCGLIPIAPSASDTRQGGSRVNPARGSRLLQDRILRRFVSRCLEIALAGRWFSP